METKNFIKLKSQGYIQERDDDNKQNFDLIESIMELEKELMQQPSSAVIMQRTELNCVSQNLLQIQNDQSYSNKNVLQSQTDYTNYGQGYYVSPSCKISDLIM